MKALLFTALTFLSLNLNAQHMNDAQNTITKLFVNTDDRNWNAVETCFANRVLLDYSSMSGNPAEELTPDQIVSAWKTILPGFTATHHQLGNVLTNINGDSAHVFCYGTASHFLEDENGHVWTVVGTYDFDLVRDANSFWKISSMTFHFKYQDGNTSLPQKAIEYAKKSK